MRGTVRHELPDEGELSVPCGYVVSRSLLDKGGSRIELPTRGRSASGREVVVARWRQRAVRTAQHRVRAATGVLPESQSGLSTLPKLRYGSGSNRHVKRLPPSRG